MSKFADLHRATRALVEDRTVLLDDPRHRELDRQKSDRLDGLIDDCLARLDEIPGPAAGFDTRKARDQARYDEVRAELDQWLACRDVHNETVALKFATALSESARRAEAEARAFDLALEEIFQ